MNLWNILNGTLINTATVAAGSIIGLLFSSRIPERYQRIILQALGLMTVMLAIDAGVIEMGSAVQRFGVDDQGLGVPTYGARLGMVVIASLVVGAVIGTALRLQERLERLGRIVHERFAKPAPPASEPAPQVEDPPRRGARPSPPAEGPYTGVQGAGALQSANLPIATSPNPAARFAEGFLTSSVVFCVGPLTLLGCLNNGTVGDPSLLYVKACLDAFSSLALAASLGAGVLGSIATVLLFQGGLALAAAWLARGVPDLSLSLMNVVGGMILLATALLLLDIKKIPVANLLPGIFLPPLVVAIVERVAPGTLILGG
ncbi:MAG TPA: DUF554 domain-containing protein [Phycisphaerae bacterium]|nr:DUF554 domain-containing protein [Phycisphaerae bacterium]